MSDFRDCVDLASQRLGAVALATNDDYFAEVDNLLRPEPAEWKPHAYTDRGKWMDGWESRRKRVPGYDWAIVRLGVPGVLKGVVVDTAFFRGNFPAFCSIDACAAPTDALPETLFSPETRWVEVLPKSALQGNTENLFAIDSPWAFTHVRLNIYPDGGVARLRVHGMVVPDWRRIGHARGEVDLAAIEHGGDALACSDMFFGERKNLLMPGRARNMSDGWETRRRRDPGPDWSILKLGAVGMVRRLELDTNHFRGNYPDTASVEALLAPDATLEALTDPAAPWRPLLARTKLQAHTRHFYEDTLAALGPVSHLRLQVYPDGGVSRMRVHCELDRAARLSLGLRRLNTLPPAEAEDDLLRCTGARKVASGLAAVRPFASPESLYAASESLWSTTEPSDWHEAFSRHPRIGERAAVQTRSASEAQWSAGEQAGVHRADDATRTALAEVNAAYEARFGHLYLVCATGKSADELLAIARSRLGNDPETELRVAADELRKITRIRLEKLLEP